MTIVLCNWGDDDTQSLKYIWKDLNANIIELKASSTKEELKKLEDIYKEEDTLILLGHGGPEGLWFPNFSSYYSSGYVFSKNDSYQLKCKNLVGIWCNASQFSKRYNVPGFFTDMFISNVNEASYCGIHNVSQQDITKCEIEFCNKVNQLLKDKVPLNQWVDNIKSSLLNENSNEVEKFNYNGLYYKER